MRDLIWCSFEMLQLWTLVRGARVLDGILKAVELHPIGRNEQGIVQVRHERHGRPMDGPHVGAMATAGARRHDSARLGRNEADLNSGSRMLLEFKMQIYLSNQ